jgi:ketosteroid isomerase-like protein
MSDLRELLDRMYRAVWEDGDLDAAFADLPDDFEWVVPGHPDGDVHRGRAAVTRFFRDWIDQWDDPESEWHLEPTAPDTVLSVSITRGRGRASGVPVELRFVQVWTFRDEVPVRMVVYPDEAKARAAATAGP